MLKLSHSDSAAVPSVKDLEVVLNYTISFQSSPKEETVQL